MKRLIKTLCALYIFSLGCNNYEDKNILSNKELVHCIDSISPDGYCDRYCEVFYPTGELYYSYTTKGDSIINGAHKTFFKNGVLMDSSFYVGGILFGVRKIYYSNGKRKQFMEYISLGESSYRNTNAEYDSITGNMIKEKSFYYSFELNQISEKDSVEVDFTFDLPMYSDTAYIEIGDFDEFFRLSSKELNQYIPVKNNHSTFLIEKSKVGQTYIRGIIYNYDFNNPTKIRRFYFYEKCC